MSCGVRWLRKAISTARSWRGSRPGPQRLALGASCLPGVRIGVGSGFLLLKAYSSRCLEAIEEQRYDYRNRFVDMTTDRKNESARLSGRPDARLRLIVDQPVLILQQKLLIHIPVAYANTRATWLFFMQTRYHTVNGKSLRRNLVQRPRCLWHR